MLKTCYRRWVYSVGKANAMTTGNSGHEPVSWLVAITKSVGAFAAVLGGIGGLGAIMIPLASDPAPPGSPGSQRPSAIAPPLAVGLGVLMVLLAAAGLICAYGKGRRSTRVRLGGLLAVDMIFVIGVVLFRVFGT